MSSRVENKVKDVAIAEARMIRDPSHGDFGLDLPAMQRLRGAAPSLGRVE
jgi:hypothetical protein